MPRKLDKKVIQARIKGNKARMKNHKMFLMAEIKAATKGEDVDQKAARAFLTTFMRAALAVTADYAKLDSLKTSDEKESNNGE